MTSASVEPTPDRKAGRPRRLRWWKEVIFAAVFYACYSAVRDIRGSKPVSVVQAYHNALRVIRVERWFGLFQERHIQDLFLSDRRLVQFLNVFYGSAHFVVTLIVLVWLFRRAPRRYPLWRNTLAITTGLALIGFAFFPLMPPRLLPANFHFVDTLHAIGGLWSFDSGPVNKVSNQYAAMPSLHFAWSSWCALVLLPALRHAWSRALALAYPVLTLFAIVVTANHYILDAVGGAVILGAGFLLALPLTRAIGRVPAPADAASGEPQPEDMPRLRVASPRRNGHEAAAPLARPRRVAGR